jgi:hypothetical protein
MANQLTSPIPRAKMPWGLKIDSGATPQPAQLLWLALLAGVPWIVVLLLPSTRAQRARQNFAQKNTRSSLGG